MRPTLRGWKATSIGTTGRNTTPVTAKTISGSTYNDYKFTVTDFVQQWVGGSLANHGFKLELAGTANDLTVDCRSSDHSTSTERPKLVIKYRQTTTPIVRAYYSLAGQMIAVRVSNDPLSTNNGLWHMHSDHLGSSRLMSDSAGAVKVGSTTRFLPYGGYRTTPTTGITDRGFTGHQMQDELGLIYNAGEVVCARGGKVCVGRYDGAGPQESTGFQSLRLYLE